MSGLQLVIDQVSQEKGIDPKILVEAMEQAILMAAKRTFGMGRELEARYNPDTGAVDLFQYMTVAEDVDDEEREVSAEDAARYGLESELGEELGFQIFYMPEDSEKAQQQDREFGDLLQLQQARHGFGRIAAQTAKQVIIQRVRDAERDRIFEEYKDRIGEILTGVVRRFERGNNLIVDLGRSVEAMLPYREQTPRESYRPGDRIVALLKKIDREAKGPQLILSRSDNGLLVKLFEMEVPEIYEGIVRIVAASREPGARSKIAVSSRDGDVDPVGACVGMKGSRVQAVVQELRGEKIDIVPWDRDPARFVCNAIAPAEVVRVVIDDSNHSMELVVPDAKLSLAIGRRGQNVRLASHLTEWRLDIVSESRFKQLEEQALEMFSRIPGADENFARALYKQGFRGLDEVAEAPVEELAQLPEIGPERAPVVKSGAGEALEAVRRERLEAAAESGEDLDEKQRMLLMSGMTVRTVEIIDQNGYHTIEQVAEETDPSRFAGKTGLGTERAQQIIEGARSFLTEEWPSVAERRAVVRASMPEVPTPSDDAGDGVEGHEPASEVDAVVAAGGAADPETDTNLVQGGG